MPLWCAVQLTVDRFTIEVPSNIAFLKYWGKDNVDQQWPANNSLSMTLNNCRTITNIQLNNQQDCFYLHGQLLSATDRHGEKIYRQINFLRQQLGLANSKFVTIDSRNTFPTSCGIASSASGIAALTIACLACWTDSYDFASLATAGFDRSRLADLTRQGSGSAGRSLWGGFVRWQRGNSYRQQTLEQLYPASHWQLADIIVSSAVSKTDSSSYGHKLAKSSPMFNQRLFNLPQREQTLIKALDNRDFVTLGTILEEEALEFHRILTTSTPPLTYHDNDLQKIWHWVQQSRTKGQDAYFTIDAGGSVHIICQAQMMERISQQVQKVYGNRYLVLVDTIGTGPSLVVDDG